MRRWFAALALMAALAGCRGGLPEGTDGDLTNRWKAPPQAQSWRPVIGKCFDEIARVTDPDTYAPISCDELHIAETYYVGDLTGEAAAPLGAASKNSPARLAAYRECSRRADDFVNGRWRTGFFAVEPVLPNANGWTGGARWFRCDIVETNDDGDPISGKKSLRDAMDDPTWRLGCFNPVVEGEDVVGLTSVDCAHPHHAEFAGLWNAPKISLEKMQNSAAMRKGCLSTIAHYTKVPDDSDMHYRTGWLGLPGDELAWAAGDRSVQCFMWFSRETMTGSYRGAGPRKLFIHYA